MKKLKKTLLTLLLGAGLNLGAEKIKAQEVQTEFINNDGDDFPEEVFGALTKDNKTMIIYYRDKDNDDFHEQIRLIYLTKGDYNIYKFKEKNMYLSKSSGYIEYSVSNFAVNRFLYNKTFSKMSYKELIINGAVLPKRAQINSERWEALTKQDIYSIFGAAYGDRFEKIINGSQSKIKLNTLIQEEMSQ